MLIGFFDGWNLNLFCSIENGRKKREIGCSSHGTNSSIVGFVMGKDIGEKMRETDHKREKRNISSMIYYDLSLDSPHKGTIRK